MSKSAIRTINAALVIIAAADVKLPPLTLNCRTC